MRRGLGRRGVALMLVLWVLVVLGAIAAGVSALVRAEGRAVANARARSQARYAAESGVLAATTELRRLLGEAATPRDQALVFRELDDRLTALHQATLGDARFQVAVADLNARVDLNHADGATVRALLARFAGERHADRLWSALEDWKDADDDPRPGGAETSDYVAVGSVFRPANRPLQRLDELTRIAGFTDSIAGLLAPYITVHGDGRINLNTAPEPVLAAVPWLGPEGARIVVAQREDGTVFESLIQVPGLFRALPPPTARVDASRISTMPRRLLVVSRGWVEGHPLTHEIQAVFDLEGMRLADGPRLHARFWVERDR